jgi:glycosyltransferase involved in cell wall biosynthesis
MSQEFSMQLDPAFLSGGRRLKCLVAEDGAKACTEMPLVTVVTAAFNGQQFMAACLESVLRQDYPNIEHLVLDGGSTDGTLDVLRQYDDRIALWKSEPDEGVYDAWNKGLQEARGEWICFLGADDELLPGAVSAYMELATQNPKAEYLTSRVEWVQLSGDRRIIGHPWKWKEFSRWMCTAHVGSMHRRSLYNRLGNYDTSYRSAADYEFLLRARGQLHAAYTPTVTVMMRAGGVSDNTSALAETKRAKIDAGGRNKVLAELEFQIAKTKFAPRPLSSALRKIMKR